MADAVQKRVARTLYRNIFRFCKALDSSAPNAVNGQLVKLSAHLKVSSVHSSLAKSAVRAYPQKILMESEYASSAAQQLFRMPLPSNEYEAAQETGYRMDMAFAALRFLNDRYSHVVEQRNDVVKHKDWVNIIKRAERVEDGAIAIARAADANVEAATVYMELDRIAALVRDRIVTLEAAEIANAKAEAESEAASESNVESAAEREVEKVVVRARSPEVQHNRYSLQDYSSQDSEDSQASHSHVTHDAPPRVLPSNQPDNRYSLLEAAARVAGEGNAVPAHLVAGAAEESSMERPEESGGALARAYAAKAAEAATMEPVKAAPPASLPLALIALNEVLFGDLGFAGNRQDYYDPGNSMIQEVLQMRCGNPITLSVVYLAVARRVGLSLGGAECPSHFIVRGTNNDGENYFVDVFNGGKVMSLDSCKEMFLTARSALLDEQDLSPVSPVQIYSRMMRNLVNSHMILGNGDKALLWTERLRVLEQANLSLIAPAQAVAEEEPRGWRGRIHQPK